MASLDAKIAGAEDLFQDLSEEATEIVSGGINYAEAKALASFTSDIGGVALTFTKTIGIDLAKLHISFSGAGALSISIGSGNTIALTASQATT